MLTRRWNAWIGRLARLAAGLGLATIGWDRLANLEIAGFNLKTPTLMFSVATALGLVAILTTRQQKRSTALETLRGSLFVVMVSMLAIMFLSAALSLHPYPAFLQIGTVVVGAFVPLTAVILTTESRSHLASALMYFLVGGLISALFGFYQLIAGVIGWPQGIEYEALGGGLPRISSFTYESGYFGYYMVLCLAACTAWAYLHRTRAALWFALSSFVVFLVALVAANTRAAYATIPLLIVFLLFAQRRRIPSVRAVALIAGACVTGVVLTFVIAPVIMRTAVERLTSIFDPTEVSSNAPRLALLKTAYAAYADRPVLGIGPGNFYFVVDQYGGGSDGTSPNSVVTNNAYLQALLDGGPLLLVAQVTFMILIAVRCYRWSRPVSAYILAGWLAVVLVAFLGTSYYWDLKLWAVAGLALVAARIDTSPHLETGMQQETAQPGMAGGTRTGTLQA